MAELLIEHYSQNDEQEVILDYFKNFTGRFLDIGAYDGKTLSNTYALSLKGWSGVCVEPSPKNFEVLDEQYSNNPNVKLLNCAVGPVDGLIEFWDTPNDFYGSITKGNGNKYGKIENRVFVECVTVVSLFEAVDYDFDFISLDVEGNNFEVLKSIPFDCLNNLSMICIESDGRWDEIIDYMKGFDFKELHRTPENILMVRE